MFSNTVRQHSKRAADLTYFTILLVALAGEARAVTIDTVPVGNVGNANDPATGFGGVGYAYNIGKYDVTVGQYAAFLNAVAATDTYGLYNPAMATDLTIAGISRSGASGSYSYSVLGSANKPVTYVSWGGRGPLLQLAAQRPVDRRAKRGHHRRRRLFRQRSDHQCGLESRNAQRRRPMVHSDGKRVVQGGLPRAGGARGRCRRLLALSDPDQQHALLRPAAGKRRPNAIEYGQLQQRG